MSHPPTCYPIRCDFPQEWRLEHECPKKPLWYSHDPKTLITLKHVKLWLSQAGHSHFTSNALVLVRQYIIDFLTNITERALMIMQGDRFMSVRCTHVIDAMAAQGLRLYGYGNMVKISDHVHHETELVTEFDDKDNMDREYTSPNTPPQYYAPVTLSREYFHLGGSESEDGSDSDTDVVTNEVQNDSASDSDSDSDDDSEKVVRASPLDEEIAAAQRILDTWRCDDIATLSERPFGQEDIETLAAELEEAHGSLVWDIYTPSDSQQLASQTNETSSSDVASPVMYYEISEECEVPSTPMILTHLMTQAEFVNFIASVQHMPIPWTAAAVSAFQAVFENELMRELSTGVTAWKINQDALTWRYACQVASNETLQVDALACGQELRDTQTLLGSTTSALRDLEKRYAALKNNTIDANNNNTVNLQLPGSHANENEVTKPLIVGTGGGFSRLTSLKRALTNAVLNPNKKSKVAPANNNNSSSASS